MKKNFEEVNICDACNSRDIKPFITSPDRNYHTGTFTYVQCKRCNLVWLSPRPTQRVIFRYYPKQYVAYQLPRQLNAVQKEFRILLKNRFIARFFIKDKLYFVKNKGKILDVGTGNGAYLDILRDWGYEVYGVEINEKSSNDARKRGLNVKTGDLFSARQPSNYFEIVRFSHVLEHVPSPSKVLKETNRILKKNGKVFIYVPNIDSLLFRVFKSYWYPLEPPRHLYHYHENNVKKLLKDTGFKKIDIKYYQSPYSLIRSLAYLMGRKNVEKRIGFLAYPITLLLKVISVFKLSDTLIITAVKK